MAIIQINEFNFVLFYDYMKIIHLAKISWDRSLWEGRDRANKNEKTKEISIFSIYE